MNFLAPLFLLGGLAVALPVVFHLIRRTTRERTQFSSLMFLLPTPPRLTRRSRLEHLLLLALRCLVLGLLALGFARPFFRQAVSNEPPTGAAKRIVVLVDTSASMRRANLWADARAKAEAALRKTSPLDQAAVLGFDRRSIPLVTFEEWSAAPAGERVALATRRLAETQPGWAASHLGDALITAAEMLADNTGKAPAGPRQIVFISDLQEGNRLDQLQGYEWPKGVELSLEPVKARNPSNAGLQLVADAEDGDRKAPTTVRVRVNNASESKREQFKVGWAQANNAGFVGAPVEIYVPPGQSRIVPLPIPAVGIAADRVVLQGDDEKFDNTVFVMPPETARLDVLYLGSDAEKDARRPLYFLERAFQDTRRQTVRLLARPPGQPIPAPEAQAAALVVVTDALPDDRAAAMHDLVAAGKTLLCALRNESGAATLARLLGASTLKLEEARPNGYAMLAEIDFRHPLLAPFADPRFSDFTKIHFWKYRRLDLAAIPGAHTVAKFDNGDAALLDVPVGKGHVLVLTSGWTPDDSQLALSTKFVPLLYSILEQSGAAPPLPAQYFVGDVVPLALLADPGASALSLRGPDGAPIPIAPGETNFTQTLTPGVYTLGSAPPAKRFVVNLDAAESRTTPMAADELERLGAPIARQVPTTSREAERKVQLQSAELESRQQLWRWILVVTIAVLLFETWLAGRTARRLAVPTEAGS